MATRAPVPKDAPDRVHTYALVRVTIEYQKSGDGVPWGMSSTSTYIKLSNGSGDRQKFYVPLSKWSKSTGHPCIARDVPSSSPSHGAISGAHGEQYSTHTYVLHNHLSCRPYTRATSRAQWLLDILPLLSPLRSLESPASVVFSCDSSNLYFERATQRAPCSTCAGIVPVHRVLCPARIYLTPSQTPRPCPAEFSTPKGHRSTPQGAWGARGVARVVVITLRH